MRVSSGLLIAIPALLVVSFSMARTADENAEAPLYTKVLGDLIAHPAPTYPHEARDRHIHGKGDYLVAFDSRTGVVRQVSIVRSTGYAILDQTAIESLRQWKVKPKTIERVHVPITFNFLRRVDDRTESQSNPNVLYAPYPRFPKSYEWDYGSAEGVFEIQIDQSTGRVASVHVVETMGDDRLDNFASLTLRHWRFRPHTLSHFEVTLGF